MKKHVQSGINSFTTLLIPLAAYYTGSWRWVLLIVVLQAVAAWIQFRDPTARAEFRKELWIRMVAPIGGTILLAALFFLAYSYRNPSHLALR